MNEPFTMDEITTALKQLKSGKTPGISGLTTEFYKIFWAKFKDIFYEALEEMYNQQLMDEEFCIGIINLIPKAKRDSRYLKNLRPITLLETCYKIVEKTIANRIETVLDIIIHKNQQGFIKNRRLAGNVRKIFDLMQFTKREGIGAYILSLDFMKCFDYIEHQAITGAMEFFKFPTYMVTWTEILYKTFSAKVQNNGNFSEPFPVERGVRQGGPASSLFFLLCAEILAIDLRADQEIKGIPVEDILNLLSQFADDMDIYTLHDQTSVNHIFDILEKFKKTAGFTVNYDKTQMYRIGSLANTESKLITAEQIKWTNNPINVLGITVTQTEEELLMLNYQDILEKVKAILKAWSCRTLSLIGKINVVNTLIGSLFIHKMMVLPAIPENLIILMENEITKFLWNGHKPKIPLSVLQKLKKNGGLKLTNLRMRDKAIKIAWIKYIITDNQLATIAYHLINKNLKEDIWKCNISTKDLSALIQDGCPKFWTDTVYAWSEYSYSLQLNESFLWYNSKIRIKDEPFFWSKPYSKGLKYVHQLYEKDKLLSIRKAFTKFELTLMQYNSLVSAIPKILKDKAKKDKFQTTEHRIPEAQAAYEHFIKDDYMLSEKMKKWENETGETIEYCVFEAFFSDLNKVTNIPKYRSFQYRLLHRAIITNIHLKHWKIIETDTCLFCGTDRESYIHLFVLCKKVEQIWIAMDRIFQEYSKDIINFSVNSVLFNRLVASKPNHVLNFLCLITKQYIYRQRCLRKELNFQELRNIIYQLENLEKYKAVKNNKTFLHVKKWRPQELKTV